MRIEGAIFDLDGTLTDSMYIWNEAPKALVDPERMGQALLRLAAAAPEAFQVVAAVSGRTPAQRVVEGVPHFAAAELAGVPEFDVAIDFSLPEGFDPVLALCVARGRALVSGTTGLEAAQRGALEAAAG